MQTGKLIALIQASLISKDRKDFWISKIPSLNEFWIKKLYEVFSADSIAKLKELESNEIEYQKGLMKKIEKLNNFVKKIFKVIEQKTRTKENPDNFLNYQINKL